MEKVKLMCSYGGKIHHRPHDRQLSYVGGDTKILTIDRNINFSNLLAKLNALCDYYYEIRLKYKLPGQDLDALISIFDDDDVENMMFEYDLLRRISATPPRLRLFVFFQMATTTTTPVASRSVNPDFLFGFDKEYSLNYTTVVKNPEDKDTVVSPPENVGIADGVQKQIQEIPVPVLDNRTMTHGSYVFPTPFVYRAPMPSSGYFQAGEYRGVGNREQPVVYSFIPGGNREQPVGYGFIPVVAQEQPNIPMSGSPLSYDAARGESQLPTVMMGATCNHDGTGAQHDA
ncbi:uncharacterized protein LOC112515728 [Cynara cardunculus var. scolymus]|uniref:PB1 domain-containing protein n=1 Tax=Cynara cardunculus var. scolymus TaxID=59895 RepID=A0A103XKD4_CYNCS|nr:uncharacterized protein LOC112515728 [Cynara cardunculus var. scolymus]KVH92373.1 hypothetical protein Ccrd_005560 [Cynara cardunculus var. scolymus]